MKVDSRDLQKVKISESIIPESQYYQISSTIHLKSTPKNEEHALTISINGN